jgi:hypothetical protein
MFSNQKSRFENFIPFDDQQKVSRKERFKFYMQKFKKEEDKKKEDEKLLARQKYEQTLKQ